MPRRLALGLVILVVLAFAPAALGAYPGPFPTQGGQGVLSADGTLRFVATKDGADTMLNAVRRSDGTTVMSKRVAGAFGVAVLSPRGGYGEGLSHDGSTLVLQSMGLAAKTEFALVDTSDLTTRDQISLKGTFAFDALSPDGSRLYLIQHSSLADIQHYVVRGYDLDEHALLPGTIADKTQRNWVMQGWAVNRAATASGRWVYTLYANPGGAPFVHALDTVRGIAHCVGLPWAATDGSQNEVFNFTLGLKGTRLAVRRQNGTAYRFIDTRTWRLSKPAAR